jgi:hypothetical protein
MDAVAGQLWHDEYPRLTRERPGLLGALTARSEAQAVRLALMYAVLDCQRQIGLSHLKAALELMRYEERSVRHIFGRALGDPVADCIIDELRQIAPAGLSRTQISELFARNHERERISAALHVLLRLGVVRRGHQPSPRGRPTEVWFACEED